MSYCNALRLFACNLQQGAMIALAEDRQLWPVRFVILRTLLIAAAQRLGDAYIKLRDCAFELSADFGERPF